jgi:uncharacterized protein
MMAAEIPLRPLGRTGFKASALGLGGHHLGDVPTVDEAIELVHEAIDAGITFFDNCWEYYDGRSEDWMGGGLKGKRDRVVLMTKVCTHGRSGALGLQMLEQSLCRLQTDHLDLWQIHDMAFDNDPELAYAKGGIVEALDKAKRQGKTRFVGFTGHKNPMVHLKMLEIGYPFDTVQMPLNAFDGTFRSFEQQVLPAPGTAPSDTRASRASMVTIAGFPGPIPSASASGTPRPSIFTTRRDGGPDSSRSKATVALSRRSPSVISACAI